MVGLRSVRRGLGNHGDGASEDFRNFGVAMRFIGRVSGVGKGCVLENHGDIIGVGLYSRLAHQPGCHELLLAMNTMTDQESTEEEGLSCSAHMAG